MKLVYHKTKKATYYDGGTGELHVYYHTKHGGRRFYVGDSQHICHVKNDEQGWAYINNVIRSKYQCALKFHYRCPNDGQPYNPKNSHHNRGNVNKSRGLVINVRKR